MENLTETTTDSFDDNLANAKPHQSTEEGCPVSEAPAMDEESGAAIIAERDQPAGWKILGCPGASTSFNLGTGRQNLSGAGVISWSVPARE